ncbi:hypothetical protein DKM44_11115 [Deinococcus irradiatisoli]|uniref:Uncharacterized protein n=1 Tax=Deinococcus irradiatisoli TaxID=2202254 RepID=A0A2Z3JJF0_9DEIO|nr:hypothetical protein DKM44_11115 [Deinococcus irradiatisoli]
MTVKPAAAPAAAPGRSGPAQKRAPAQARPARTRAEPGPSLSDWLSLGLLGLLVALSVSIYQWRERPGPHKLPASPPAATRLLPAGGDPAFSHCAAPPTQRRLSA